jgi:2-hydroxy-3-keto-5-methylthiopentenyl-1-phosphate phosphatase
MNASRNFEIYFDFDNTITDFDVLDDIIQRFSTNDDWKRAEAAWESGEIGSRECLEKQLSQMRMTAGALRNYLDSVKIDSFFRPILELLNAHHIEPVIVSDSFRLIIDRILENNGVMGLTVLANDLRMEGEQPVPEFPYYQSICCGCANCKTSHLFKRNRPEGTKKIYVGDGRSDICPAGFCEILFAKGGLLRHYQEIGKECIPFENLGAVHTHLQHLLQ